VRREVLFVRRAQGKVGGEDFGNSKTAEREGRVQSTGLKLKRGVASSKGNKDTAVKYFRSTIR